MIEAKSKIMKQEAQKYFEELLNNAEAEEYLKWLSSLAWKYTIGEASEHFVSPFQYFGSKNNLAKQIVMMLDYDKFIYAEPFFGSGAVFFSKPPHKIEYVNDLDKNLYVVYSYLQKPENTIYLLYRLFFIQNNYEIYKNAVKILRDKDRFEKYDIDDIVFAYFVANLMSISGLGTTKKASPGSWSRTRYKRNCNVGGQVNMRLYKRVYLLPYYWYRLKNANIDCRDAIKVIKNYDSPNTMFYLDPPYIIETREENSRRIYQTELDNSYHKNLVDLLLSAKGKVLLSGYDHEIYHRLEKHGWDRYEIDVLATFGVKVGEKRTQRKEIVWANYDIREQIKKNKEKQNPRLF